MYLIFAKRFLDRKIKSKIERTVKK